MQRIFLILSLFVVTSCGIKSYYMNETDAQNELLTDLTREQVKLTRIEFFLTDNPDRIFKEELLRDMERLDTNDEQDYRYIMIVSTNYIVSPTFFSPTGITMGNYITLLTNYIIADTKIINKTTKTETTTTILTEATEEEMSNFQPAPSKLDLLHNIQIDPLKKDIKKYDKAKDERFSREANYLRQNFAIVQEGQIVSTEEFLLSNVLLYSDYVALDRAKELVAKKAATSLFYNLISIYANYIDSENYNSKDLGDNSGPNSIDLFVEKTRKKLSPIISEYTSIHNIRDKILDKIESRNTEKNKKNNYILY